MYILMVGGGGALWRLEKNEQSDYGRFNNFFCLFACQRSVLYTCIPLLRRWIEVELRPHPPLTSFNVFELMSVSNLMKSNNSLQGG